MVGRLDFVSNQVMEVADLIYLPVPFKVVPIPKLTTDPIKYSKHELL